MPKKRAKPQNRAIPILLMLVGLALVIAAIVFSQSLPQSVPAPTPDALRVPYPEVPRISLADAKAAFDLGSALFIDVRGEPYYSQGHIQNALSVAESDLDAALPQLDPQAWIITYCT